MTPATRRRLAVLCALALPWLGPHELPARPDRAAWMKQAGWGVMVHYLPDWIDPGRAWTSAAWDAQVDGFDVEAFARQVHEAGAGYVLLSIGQNSGFYLAPNPTYDRLTGARPSRCSRRDVVADLSEALSRRGLRLLVYLPSGPPSNDPAAARALGWEGEDQPNRAFQGRWEQVIADWSVRWGGTVSGWWFDGCSRPNIRHRSSEPPNFTSFAAAARAGNPDAIVAFSPGLYYPVFPLSPHEDYTAGLIYDFEREFANPGRVKDGRVDGAQLHVLSFLGRTWGRGEPRFTNEQVGAYTRRVLDLGGAVTWDVPVGADGRIAPAFVERLRAAGRALTPAPDLLLSDGWRLVEVRDRLRAGDAALAGALRHAAGPFDLWRYFRTVTLDTSATGAGVGEDVRGFPLALSLDGTHLDFTHARPDGADLRFSTTAGDALPHAIERWDAAGRRATVWVKLDVRGNDAAQSFLMHWGNADALPASDSHGVFDTRDGFAGVWHLGDEGGTAEGGYRDATGNAAHATGVNLAPQAAVEGRLGRAVDLSHAQGQWIKIDGEKRKLFDLTDKLTFSIWAKARSYPNRGGVGGRPLPGYETMFAKGDNSWRLQKFGIRGWHEPPADLVEICVERKDPKADLCVIGKTDMVTDRWFHFSGVHDHPQVKLYVNGALETVATFDSVWMSGDYPVGIGNQSQFPTEGRFWDGLLDEARVLRVVKDEHWIKLDYESQREGQELVRLGAVRGRF